MAERTTVTVFKVGTTAENAASLVPYLDDVSPESHQKRN